MKHLKPYNESFLDFFKRKKKISKDEFINEVRDICLEIKDNGFTVTKLNGGSAYPYEGTAFVITKWIYDERFGRELQEYFPISELSECILRLFEYSKIVGVEMLVAEGNKRRYDFDGKNIENWFNTENYTKTEVSTIEVLFKI